MITSDDYDLYGFKTLVCSIGRFFASYTFFLLFKEKKTKKFDNTSKSPSSKVENNRIKCTLVDLSVISNLFKKSVCLPGGWSRLDHKKVSKNNMNFKNFQIIFAKTSAGISHQITNLGVRFSSQKFSSKKSF